MLSDSDNEKQVVMVQSTHDGDVGTIELGPYVCARLRGRVAAPCKTAAGETFVPPMGPFQQLPEWMHVGAWSPTAYVFFAAVGLLLFAAATRALDETQRAAMSDVVAMAASETAAKDSAALVLRSLGGLWGVVILLGMLKEVGWWPLVSYTMISWSLLSLRLLSAAAAPFIGFAAWAAELLRFTALLQTTIVVAVWWLVIVPLLVFMEHDQHKRKMFMKWNCSFALINVHLLNLPVAAIDFLYNPRTVTLMDVWIVFMAAFVYVVFYTCFLDRRGIFLYFMFTPRTHWCWLVYTMMLAVMGGVLWGWARISDKGVLLFSDTNNTSASLW
jgi:hypothetical protein